MGAPSIYVYDCNNAGIIVESFKNFAEQHEREYAEQLRNIHSQGGSQDIQPPTSLRSVFFRLQMWCTVPVILFSKLTQIELIMKRYKLNLFNLNLIDFLFLISVCTKIQPKYPDIPKCLFLTTQLIQRSGGMKLPALPL